MLPAVLPVRSSVSPLAKAKLASLTLVSVRFSVSLVPKVSISPVMVLPVVMVPSVVAGVPAMFQTTPDPTVTVLLLSVTSVKLIVVDGPLTPRVESLSVPPLAFSVLPPGTTMVSPGCGGPLAGDQFAATEASLSLLPPIQVYVVSLMMSVPPLPSDASKKDVSL